MAGDGKNAPKIGVIGGSGLYKLDGLEIVTEHTMKTPFGDPSDAIIEGQLGTARLFFLPRHGRTHATPPHKINYRANILALKMLGVDHIISMSAVGSLREAIAPGDLVVVDQFIDRTRMRPSTFFEEGIVAHISFAEPVDAQLASALYQAALTSEARIHRGGAYICIDGPQFSTRAESKLYRAWGADVIGMTNLPEARLAREAELPYATLALATDYDAWRDDEAAVSVETVMETMKRNALNAQTALLAYVKNLPDLTDVPARSALKYAVMGDFKNSPALPKVKSLLEKYL